ncbi:hypothetical protein FB45DRAFT_121937 [Roridomyces roridus]|uniref:Uncharacterized protein n=1 Tax=Roridomyces roridus TaxID=1738132 RepID=A0AAD7BI82_9AGAR|nr:hypothetical protein FB45DRAFT_121937 [Roridomyces roridus]
MQYGNVHSSSGHEPHVIIMSTHLDHAEQLCWIWFMGSGYVVLFLFLPHTHAINCLTLHTLFSLFMSVDTSRQLPLPPDTGPRMPETPRHATRSVFSDRQRSEFFGVSYAWVVENAKASTRSACEFLRNTRTKFDSLLTGTTSISASLTTVDSDRVDRHHGVIELEGAVEDTGRSQIENWAEGNFETPSSDAPLPSVGISAVADSESLSPKSSAQPVGAGVVVDPSPESAVAHTTCRSQLIPTLDRPIRNHLALPEFCHKHRIPAELQKTLEGVGYLSSRGLLKITHEALIDVRVAPGQIDEIKGALEEFVQADLGLRDGGVHSVVAATDGTKQHDVPKHAEQIAGSMTLPPDSQMPMAVYITGGTGGAGGSASDMGGTGGDGGGTYFTLNSGPTLQIDDPLELLNMFTDKNAAQIDHPGMAFTSAINDESLNAFDIACTRFNGTSTMLIEGLDLLVEIDSFKFVKEVVVAFKLITMLDSQRVNSRKVMAVTLKMQVTMSALLKLLRKISDTDAANVKQLGVMPKVAEAIKECAKVCIVYMEKHELRESSLFPFRDPKQSTISSSESSKPRTMNNCSRTLWSSSINLRARFRRWRLSGRGSPWIRYE